MSLPAAEVPSMSPPPVAARPAAPIGVRSQPEALPWRTRLALAARLLRNLAYDGGRLWRHSFLTGTAGREQRRGRMRMDAHFLEYGMSMRDPRRGFGLDRVHRLIDDLERSLESHGPDATTEIMQRTLEAYLAFNADATVDLDWLRRRLAALAPQPATGLRGGSETVTREAIQRDGRIDFLAFAESRHSIRQYAPGPVAPETIERAVRAAQQSPSSCNRQTCRAYVWTDPALVRRVLALQSGNRGFGAEIAGVAVVASDLSHWGGPDERYQGWVDAGMFAMSLAYGLHAEGLGAVMLNWGEEHRRDKELLALTGLPDSTLVATMIGFGNLPDRLVVPVSQREPLDRCFVLNRPLASA